jgi:negative regulator of flagellin synthesis FlgM
MIDGIGKGGAGRIDLTRAQAGQGAGAAAAGQATGARAEGSAGGVVADLVAMGPPVDSDKVSAIRQAIAEGRYSVDPEAIAERMIASDLAR